MTRAWLSLGSNVDPDTHLAAAIAALRERFGNVVVSPLYRNRALGFEGADFVNAAAGLDSDLDPPALDAWLHALEDRHGRDRGGPRHGDRSLDIDIIFFGDLILDGAGPLRIPRAEREHAFVLKPLVDIAPDLVDPVSGRRLAELWRLHPQHDDPCWSQAGRLQA